MGSAHIRQGHFLLMQRPCLTISYMKRRRGLDVSKMCHFNNRQPSILHEQIHPNSVTRPLLIILGFVVFSGHLSFRTEGGQVFANCQPKVTGMYVVLRLTVRANPPQFCEPSFTHYFRLCCFFPGTCLFTQREGRFLHLLAKGNRPVCCSTLNCNVTGLSYIWQEIKA